MIKDQVNRAIAEARGFEIRTTGEEMKHDKHVTFERIHNCFEDLNACHEFEKGLTKHERSSYEVVLREAVCGKTGFWYVPHQGEVFEVVHATAPQRCEAFLRTVDPEKAKEIYGI